MIHIENCRVNSGYPCQPVHMERTGIEALNHLLEFELGFGGVITAVSETAVSVRTLVFSCVDTTNFSGSAQEMAPLVDAARLFAVACNHDEQNIDQTVAQLQDTPQGKGMRAFYVRHLAPLLIGANRLKIIMMLALGVSDEAAIEAGIKLKMKDLTAALAIFAEGGATSFTGLLADLGV